MLNWKGPTWRAAVTTESCTPSEPPRTSSRSNTSIGAATYIGVGADDRAALEAVARGQGKGLSAFIRELAEAEARRVRREAIRADGDRVVAHLAAHSEARAELDEIGAPLTDLP